TQLVRRLTWWACSMNKSIVLSCALTRELKILMRISSPTPLCLCLNFIICYIPQNIRFCTAVAGQARLTYYAISLNRRGQTEQQQSISIFERSDRPPESMATTAFPYRHVRQPCSWTWSTRYTRRFLI